MDLLAQMHVVVVVARILAMMTMQMKLKIIQKAIWKVILIPTVNFENVTICIFQEKKFDKVPAEESHIFQL
jgi:hypothetical protein